MPNRIIRDSIRTSESLSKLSAEEERHFYRLLVYADDFGRFDARAAVILGACYPLQLDSISLADVNNWNQALASANIVTIYECSDRIYGAFDNWTKYQRIRNATSRFPEPPSIVDDCQQLSAIVADCGPNGNGNGDVNVNENVNGDADADAGDLVPSPEASGDSDDSEAPAAASGTHGQEIPVWLRVLSELQQPTAEDIRRLSAWAESHDPEVLRETAYSLVQKWPEYVTQPKNKSRKPFSTFQGWVRVAEQRATSPPSRASPNGRATRHEADFADLERYKH